MIPLRPYGASTLVTARGDYPIPLTPVGNRGDCIEQLERARQRREARAYPIHNPAPFEWEAPAAPTQERRRGTAHGLSRFTPDQAAIVAEEYVAGATCPQLALKYGCSDSTISRTLRDRGVKIRKDGGNGGHATADSIRRSATVAAYLAGEAPRDIAARFGVHHRTVSRNVQAAGYPLRTAKETRAMKRGTEA